MISHRPMTKTTTVITVGACLSLIVIFSRVSFVGYMLIVALPRELLHTAWVYVAIKPNRLFADCQRVIDRPQDYYRSGTTRLDITMLPASIRSLRPTSVRLMEHCLEIDVMPFATRSGYIACRPGDEPQATRWMEKRAEGLWYYNSGPK